MKAVQTGLGLPSKLSLSSSRSSAFISLSLSLSLSLSFSLLPHLMRDVNWISHDVHLTYVCAAVLRPQLGDLQPEVLPEPQPGILPDDEVAGGEDAAVALPHQHELAQVGDVARQHERIAELDPEHLVVGDDLGAAAAAGRRLLAVRVAAVVRG